MGDESDWDILIELVCILILFFLINIVLVIFAFNGPYLLMNDLVTDLSIKQKHYNTTIEPILMNTLIFTIIFILCIIAVLGSRTGHFVRGNFLFMTIGFTFSIFSILLGIGVIDGVFDVLSDILLAFPLGGSSWGLSNFKQLRVGILLTGVITFGIQVLIYYPKVIISAVSYVLKQLYRPVKVIINKRIEKKMRYERIKAELIEDMNRFLGEEK